MEFILHGLEDPIVLPDEYLKVKQYHRLQTYLLENIDSPASPEFIMECAVIALHGGEELLDRLNDLDMDAHNNRVLEEINFHLDALLIAASKKGDDVTDEVIKGETKDEDTPLDPSPTENSDPTDEANPPE